MNTENNPRITLQDIEPRREVYSIYIVISAFMHYKKSYGLEKALHDYKEDLEELKEELPKHEFCAIIATLEHFDSSFNYDSSMKMEKIIVPITLWYEIYEFDDYTEQQLEGMINEEYSKSLPEFLKRNIILDEIDEVC